MSNSRISPLGPPVAPRSVVDALVRLIRDQVLGLAISMVVTTYVLKQVLDIIKKNIAGLLGGCLILVGLALLLPSLALVVVNALGWTASGVLTGLWPPLGCIEHSKSLL